MQRLEGVVQHYDWGDPDFIPRWLGIEPDGRSWAELWFGTHPNGPSRLADGRQLSEATGRLPYLLKILAARRPLSLQTHPDAAQAQEGFTQGVFSDPYAKPELLCALTPFQALCGVRPVDATLRLLDELGIDHLADVVAAQGPGAAFDGLFRGAIDPAPVVDACRHEDGTRLEAGWIRLLDELHPGDPSVAAALLLNLVVLEPGEALRLDAGNVHAYLRGAGVELMGASDNTVRAGLTTKPVDVGLLLRIADTTPLVEPVLPAADRFELPTAGVSLVRVAPGQCHTSTAHELAVEADGSGWYLAPGDEFAPAADAYVVAPIDAP